MECTQCGGTGTVQTGIGAMVLCGLCDAWKVVETKEDMSEHLIDPLKFAAATDNNMAASKEGMSLEECQEILERYEDWNTSQESWSVSLGNRRTQEDDIFDARRSVVLAATNRIAEIIGGG